MGNNDPQPSQQDLLTLKAQEHEQRIQSLSEVYRQQGQPFSVEGGILYTYAAPEEVIQARISAIRIPRELADCTLENFQTPAWAYSSTRDDAQEWFSGATTQSGAPHSVLLTGATGRGKSHLAVGLLKRFAGIGKKARFFSFGRVLNELRRGYEGMDASEFSDGFEVLLIDDFGSEETTKNQDERFRFILQERISDAKPTILTSNLTQDQFFRMVGDRCKSRMHQCFRFMELRSLADWRIERGRSAA